MIDRRLVLCAVASIAGHFVASEALSQLPAREVVQPERRVQVHVVNPPLEAPPPPEPPKAEPLPEPPRPATRPQPSVRPTRVIRAVPTETAPIVDAPTTAPTQPIFGVTMESTTPTGNGPSMPVGNTSRPTVGSPTTAPVKPAGGAPVAAVEVTKMPLPQGRCAGKYTDAAREAALEGVVVLDLIVDETGRARDIVVVAGLAHGLTEAATRALQDCRFTPGERDGKPVPVRVRGFKIRFLLQEGG